jgi:hypothetical protein
VTTPTGRYKVVERDRRLVTIDTLTGQEIGLPGSTSSAPPTSVVLDAPRAPMANASTPPRPSEGPSPWTKKSVATAGPIAAGKNPQDWMTTLAGLMPGARVREDGVIWLNTNASYDPEGPRLVQLTPDGKKALSSMGVGLCVFILFVTLIAIFGNIFFAAFIGVFGANALKNASKKAFQSVIAGATPV